MPEKYFYARLKPYNPRLGYMLKGMFVPELGRVVAGGDGVDEIPVWVKIDEKKAILLAQYHQQDQRPDTPAAFDIVDEHTKEQIDAAEELARRAAHGFIAVRAPSLPNSHLRARVVDATDLQDRRGDSDELIDAKLSRLADVDRRRAMQAEPALSEATEHYFGGREDAAAAVAEHHANPSAPVGGRQAALTDMLPPAPPPPRWVAPEADPESAPAAPAVAAATVETEPNDEPTIEAPTAAAPERGDPTPTASGKKLNWRDARPGRR